MRCLLCSCLLPVMAVALYGCASNGATSNTPEPRSLTAIAVPTVTPTVEIPSPFPTVIPSTTTSTPHPTQTATLTPPATLESEQAEAALRKLLQKPDCLAPCFWGIIPGQSTASEVNSIFTHLGLPFEHTIEPDGKEFYAILHKFDSGLSLLVGLKLQDGIVKTVKVSFNPEKPEDPTASREWSAYSPETLIKQYGVPSKVDFSGGMAREPADAPYITYGMKMYFDEVDLIVQYLSAYDYVKIDPTTGLLRVCPLTDQFQAVWIWPGTDPEHPPSPALPLEEVTSMTLEEFSALMTGEAEDACFDLSDEIFR